MITNPTPLPRKVLAISFPFIFCFLVQRYRSVRSSFKQPSSPTTCRTIPSYQRAHWTVRMHSCNATQPQTPAGALTCTLDNRWKVLGPNMEFLTAVSCLFSLIVVSSTSTYRYDPQSGTWLNKLSTDPHVRIKR